MSNNVEKAEKALKSALAHAGVRHIQENRVLNAIDKLVEAKIEALRNINETQTLQDRVTELENSIREIRRIANNDGVEIGTVGERVCERVEDVCHSMIGAPTPDDING